MDASIIDAALEGLRLVFSWPYIVYPIAATFVAMMFSATPGLDKVTVAHGAGHSDDVCLGPAAGHAGFGALVGGATFMGSVTAILFNVPGTASSAPSPCRRLSLAATGPRPDGARLRGRVVGSRFASGDRRAGRPGAGDANGERWRSVLPSS